MTFFVSNLDQSYKNNQISNVYNFLCKHFFEKLTSKFRDGIGLSETGLTAV
jgi:hypothetical protein